MENMKICQSCAMPLMEEKDQGTNGDETLNEDYCHYCYNQGAFLREETMEEAVETCIPFVLNGQPYHSEEEGREDMLKLFPTLKRWKKEV